MSDKTSRADGRRQGSLLSSALTRPRAAEKASPRTTSLLGAAVERERSRQAHRDAAARRAPSIVERIEPSTETTNRVKIDAAPQVAGSRIRSFTDLFAGWDDPAPEGASTARTAEVAPAPTVSRPVQIDDGLWRPLIEPMALVDGIVRSKKIIAATTVLGALAGVVAAVSTPKQYVSFAELLVDPRNLQIVERDLTGSSWLPSEATLSLIENQVRIMRSGPVLANVVEKLGLDADPDFNGSGKSLGFGEVIGMLRGLFSSSDGPQRDEMRHAIAVDAVARSLSIERSGKTFIVEVAAKTADPEKSALIANALVDVYIAKAAELQAGSAGRAADELGGRLEELRNGVEEAERRVEAYKSENDLVDAKGGLIGDDELIKLNDQLAIARARTLELNAKASTARNVSADTVLAGELPEQVANTALAQLRAQHATLAQEAAKAAVRLGPRHPERLAVEAQVADARRSVERELRRIVASIQVELKRAVQLEQELAGRLAQLKARQANVSDKLIALREIERDAAAKRSVYESYLLRAKETGEQRSINTGNVSVVSRAMPALESTGPSRAATAILGAIAGFLAGLAMGGLRGAWAALRGSRRTPGPRRPVSDPLAETPPPPPSGATGRPAAPPEAANASHDEPPVAQIPAPAPLAEPPPPAMPSPVAVAPAAVPMPPPMAAAPVPVPMPQQHFVFVPPNMAMPSPMPFVQPFAYPQPMVMAMPQPAAAWPPVTQAYWPQPAPPPQSTPAGEARLDGLRHGLSRFRAAVEDLAAARGRGG